MTTASRQEPCRILRWSLDFASQKKSRLGLELCTPRNSRQKIFQYRNTISKHHTQLQPCLVSSTRSPQAPSPSLAAIKASSLASKAPLSITSVATATLALRSSAAIPSDAKNVDIVFCIRSARRGKSILCVGV